MNFLLALYLFSIPFIPVMILCLLLVLYRTINNEHIQQLEKENMKLRYDKNVALGTLDAYQVYMENFTVTYHNSVFYDKNNDTLVIPEDLEHMGKL